MKNFGGKTINSSMQNSLKKDQFMKYFEPNLRSFISKNVGIQIFHQKFLVNTQEFYTMMYYYQFEYDLKNYQ